MTLQKQLPGKPLTDGLQERPSLGPLGLCVRGVCICFTFFLTVMHVRMHSKMYLCHVILYVYIYCISMPLLLV